MQTSFRSLKLIVILAAGFFFTQNSFAEFNGHRLGLGVGLAQIGDSSHNYFSVSGEYEYRLDPMLGVGTSLNYVFSDPNFMLLAVPQAYFHPLSGDWYINAAPLIQFGGGMGTHVGARVGTRIPLYLGVLTIIPQVNIDFINGGRNMIFGLGIGI